MLPVPDSVDIRIYDSPINLEGAMLLVGRDWTAGQAHPEVGAIIIAVPKGELSGYPSHMERLVPHEITHLVVYESFTRASYGYLPEWIDEGLATANERLPTPEYSLLLQEATSKVSCFRWRVSASLSPPARKLPSWHTHRVVASWGSSESSMVPQEYVRCSPPTGSGESCARGVQQALGISVSVNWNLDGRIA